MVRFGDCSAQIEWLHCQWRKCQNPWTALDAIVRQQLTSGHGPTYTNTHTHVQCICVCVCGTTDITKSASECTAKNVHKFSFYASGVWRAETGSNVEDSVGHRAGTGSGDRGREGECRKPVSKFHVDNNVRKLNCELFEHSSCSCSCNCNCSCRFRATTLVSFLGRCSFERETFGSAMPPPMTRFISEAYNHAVASAEIELEPRII